MVTKAVQQTHSQYIGRSRRRDIICPSLKEPLNITEGLDVGLQGFERSDITKGQDEGPRGLGDQI